MAATDEADETPHCQIGGISQSGLRLLPQRAQRYSTSLAAAVLGHHLCMLKAQRTRPRAFLTPAPQSTILNREVSAAESMSTTPPKAPINDSSDDSYAAALNEVPS